MRLIKFRQIMDQRPDHVNDQIGKKIRYLAEAQLWLQISDILWYQVCWQISLRVMDQLK